MRKNERIFDMASYDKKSKTWRGSVQINGKNFRKRGFLSKNIAEMWEKEQKFNHQKGLVDLPARDELEIIKTNRSLPRPLPRI